MCIQAGIKNNEIDDWLIADLAMHIEAFNETEKTSWEQTRAIVFNVARFGNSDPKKFPKTFERFWPFPWDKGQQKMSISGFARQYREQKKLRKQENKQ